MAHPVTRAASKRSWREFVVEANDGIVSTAGIVEGLVAADVRSHAVLLAAAVALVVGSVTTAGARYSEAAYLRDAALTAVAEEREEIARAPELEEAELAGFYRDKGLSEELAARVAAELSAADALGAHVEVELDVDADDFRSPWLAAAFSAVAFAAGGLLPILISMLVPYETRLLTTGIAVVIALAITSYVGATVGHTHPLQTVLRTVAVGVFTLLLAVLVGLAFE